MSATITALERIVAGRDRRDPERLVALRALREARRVMNKLTERHQPGIAAPLARFEDSPR
jgi:hypothetical protein